MSRYNPLSAELYRFGSILAVVVIPTVAVGEILDNYVDPLLIWGGSECSTAIVDGQEVLGCFGYPPTGIILIGLVVGVVLAYLFTWVSSPMETVDE